MLKKSMFMGIVAVLFGLVFEAKAIDFMGPPTAEIEQGQWDIGYVYSFSETDAEVSGFGIRATLENTEVSRHYANIGYGFTDYLEANIRLGFADVEDLDTDFAWGFNAKGTFASDDQIDWGALFQMSWVDSDGRENFSDLGLGTVAIEFDAYELQIAVGPTLKMDGIKLYGGLLLHLFDGDLDVTTGGAKVGFDVEEDSEFGGYVGAQMDLTQNAKLNVEGQFTGGGWGVGTGVLVRF